MISLLAVITLPSTATSVAVRLSIMTRLAIEYVETYKLEMSRTTLADVSFVIFCDLDDLGPVERA